MTVDQILIALRRGAANDYPLSVSPHEALALVAEVERLRSINDDYLLEMGRQHALLRDQAREAKTERAAVVAYLREEGSINSMLSVLKGAADEIERGEHRREVGA